MMPRPPKLRRIESLPQVSVFKPSGIPLSELQEINLTVVELEALRLKNLEGLGQEECAERMQVSRTTFQRIITTAHEKVSQAVVEGRALRIEGGAYRLAKRRFYCRPCDNEFEVPYGTGRRGRELQCPNCQSHDVHRQKGGPNRQ